MLWLLAALALSAPSIRTAPQVGSGPSITVPGGASNFSPGNAVPLAAQCTGNVPSGMFTHNGTNEAITTTRASNAYCSKSDGTIVLVANNVPRIEYYGLRAEPASSNIVTDPRDLTTVNWTKTNTTATRSTGADGVASSGSTITATGVNGTALQSIILGSSQNTTSMYIKRRTGTGTVSVTRDNGGTWTDVSGSISSTEWRRVQNKCRSAAAMYNTRGIPNCIEVTNLSAVSINPTVGFRLGANGDAIDVDIIQNEAQTYATSPMAGFSRAADIVTTSSSGIPTSSAELLMDAVFNYEMGGLAGASFLVDTSQNAAAGGVSFGANQANSVMYSSWNNGASSTSIVGLLNGSGLGDQFDLRWVWTGGNVYGYLQGLAPPTIAAAPRLTGGTANMPNVHTAVTYGSLLGGSLLNGWLTRIRWTTVASTNFTGRAYVLFGDSIVAGTLVPEVETRPPFSLQQTVGGLASEKYVSSTAQAGYTIDQCKTQWDALITSVVAHGVQSTTKFILQCGINSLGDGCPSVSGKITTMLTDAKAAGITVVPATITPTGGSAVITCINAAIAVWATANSVTLADTNTPLNDGAGNLLPAYSIDGMHPNAAGTGIMMNRWITAGNL